jgi:YHS domain-containing protein
MLLGWLLRILLIVLVLRAIWRFARGLMEGVRGAAPRQAGPGAAPVPLVKDPVCGTYVVRAKALTAGTGPDTRHFCSEACRDHFLRERSPNERSA